MKRLIFACTLLIISACAGRSPGTNRSLRVFAAASLIDAFTEIGLAFESDHPGTDVTFNFAGSQALRTQIEAGAQADIFASANTGEMELLTQSGFVEPGAARIFANNQVVVILPADNPAGIDSLDDLAQSGVKLVLAAEEVPAGEYARQSLDLMKSDFGADFPGRVLENVVSNEDNVKQVVAKVELGEADAGLVYASDAAASPGLERLEIPPEFNLRARYPVAALAESPEKELARAFIESLLSPKGRSILEKWGFFAP